MAQFTAPSAEEMTEAEVAAQDNLLLSAVRNGEWLNEQDFPELAYAVPGLVPEGFTLLVGAPKAGKSWLALGVQLAVASGGAALGKIPIAQPARVLYLALEDGDRRMQDRCRQLLGDDPIPKLYDYITQVQPGLIYATIEAYLRRHGDTALVVVDTLGKVMPPPEQGETTYGRDYRVGSRMKRIADDHPGLALLALHHDRKAGSEDFVARVSGTNGLAGAADTIIVLDRPRQSTDGQLSVTGRDVPESEYALSLQGAGCWVLAGDDLAAAAQTATTRRATADLGDRSVDVFAEVGKHPAGVGPSQVAAATGIDAKQVQVYLSRLVEAKRIAKPGRGKYAPLNPVGCVGSVGFPGPDDQPRQHTQHTQQGLEGPDWLACACGNQIYDPKRTVCGRCLNTGDLA